MHTIFSLSSLYSHVGCNRLNTYSTKKPLRKERPIVRGAEWIRTTDSRIFSPMLYQLSYSTSNWRHKSIQKLNRCKTFSINIEYL